MSETNPMNGFCGAKTRKGTPCKLPMGHGTSHVGTGRCGKHGGLSPNAEVAGQVMLARREMGVMGRALAIEPHEAILECIRIAAGEVEYASERIAELSADDVAGPVVTTLERPLREEKGAESTTRTVTEVSQGPPALHVWWRARDEAMERLVKFSAAALKAGIQERLVKVAEDQAKLLAEAMRRMAESLGHKPSDPRVREAMRASLTLISGGQRAA